MSARGVGLRLYFLGFALAIVVPMAAMTGFLILSTWREQQANVDRQNVQTARAISVALDREVGNTISALNVMGAVNFLDPDDLTQFEAFAAGRAAERPAWHAVMLADADGAVLMNTRVAASIARARAVRDWPRRTLESGQPAVSDLIERPGENGYYVIATVPVHREGALYVLGAELGTDALESLLRQQELPPGGVVTLLDRDLRILARTRGGGALVGQLPTEGFQDASRRMTEGTWRDTLLEGTPVYSALSRSALTGWTVGVGLPSGPIDRPLRRNLWLLLGSSLLLIAAGALMASWFARMLQLSLEAAAGAAMAVARREPVALMPSPIRELNQLGLGLQDAGSALSASLRERDEAERLKDEFLMTLSHELRTPLTVIAGWARMLVTGQIADDQRKRAAEVIDRNASALTQLVDDLLDVSRSMTGKLRLELRWIDFGEVVRRSVDAAAPAAAAKAIGLAADISAEVGRLQGDPDRLQQVIWNLLTNAVKFTPRGGRVSVDAHRAGEQIELVVSDTGSGIDPAFLPHVFERFRQAKAGPTREYGGLGIGLSIVRQLVEMHGGTVEARNNAGPGATFVVRLPIVGERPDAQDVRLPSVDESRASDSATA